MATFTRSTFVKVRCRRYMSVVQSPAPKISTSATILPYSTVGAVAMNENNSEIYSRLAKLIGFGGLIPFIGCAALMYVGNTGASNIALFASAVYGAVILSFVGAVHWGLTISEDRSPYWYVWSIIPAIMGWLAIVFLDIKISLLALTVAFTLAWSVDRQASLHGLIPSWYMRLRHILTAGATISLLVTAFAPPLS